MVEECSACCRGSFIDLDIDNWCRGRLNGRKTDQLYNELGMMEAYTVDLT
jgi:hypothetical protein